MKWDRNERAEQTQQLVCVRCIDKTRVSFTVAHSKRFLGTVPGQSRTLVVRKLVATRLTLPPSEKYGTTLLPRSRLERGIKPWHVATSHASHVLI